MKRLIMLGLAGLLAAVCAACSSGTPSSPAGGGGGPDPAPPAQTSGPAPTLDQVAAEIGATNIQPMDPTLYASQEATADWHGQTIDLATFASDALRDKWITAASTFGPILVKGHDYAATTG